MEANLTTTEIDPIVTQARRVMVGKMYQPIGFLVFFIFCILPWGLVMILEKVSSRQDWFISILLIVNFTTLTIQGFVQRRRFHSYKAGTPIGGWLDYRIQWLERTQKRSKHSRWWACAAVLVFLGAWYWAEGDYSRTHTIIWGCTTVVLMVLFFTLPKYGQNRLERTRRQLLALREQITE